MCYRTNDVSRMNFYFQTLTNLIFSVRYSGKFFPISYFQSPTFPSTLASDLCEEENQDQVETLPIVGSIYPSISNFDLFRGTNFDLFRGTLIYFVAPKGMQYLFSSGQTWNCIHKLGVKSRFSAHTEICRPKLVRHPPGKSLYDVLKVPAIRDVQTKSIKQNRQCYSPLFTLSLRWMSFSIILSSYYSPGVFL